MSLSIVARASTSRLVTLDQVKLTLGDLLLGIPEPSLTQMLNFYIDTVSTDVSLAVGRSADEHLGRQTYTEGIGVHRANRILLARWPVDRDSITVTIRGNPVPDFVFEPKNTLFRRAGWGLVANYQSLDGATWAFAYPGDDPEEVIQVTYTAGYVLPDQITDWSAGLAPQLGDWVRPARNNPPWLYEATAVSGTAGSSVPAWPATAGSTVTDGGVTWTARDARELPDNASAMAGMLVRDLVSQRDRASDMVAATEEGFSETYMRRSEPMPHPHILQAAAALRFQI